MSPPPRAPIVHKTLFVAPQPAPGAAGHAPTPKAANKAAGATSDVTRVLPAYVGAGCAAAGLFASLVVAEPAAGRAGGPGPLTPPHVKAKLGCEKCHGKEEESAPAFKKKAKEACVGCHEPHPSTRPAHRKLAKEGELGCTTCHTIHGPQSGVKLTEDGPAIRYSTWGQKTVEDVSFHAGRTVLVPTIPLGVCTKCHQKDASDPLARCRSFAGGGDLEPTICFDEHRVALPPTKAPARRPDRDRDRDRDRTRDRDRPRDKRDDDLGIRAPSPREGACAEQHFEDRSFAWEAAREAATKVPVVDKGSGAGTSLSWLGAAGAFGLLGYAGTAGAQALGRLRSRRREASLKGGAAAPADRKRLPIVDTTTCLGCYACVDACPYGVIEVQKYVAVVARPDACCGLGLCEQRCPNGSLVVADEGSMLERPRVSPTLESEEVEGLYLAGDVTGVPLIKNAIAQGTRAAEAAYKALPSRPRPTRGGETAFDVCIVGAGPAGISAALRLRELGAEAVVLEQGGVAQSIQSFPRGKLVFDQPLELPVEGKLWLKESSKEELLLNWMRIVRKAGLEIHEGVRMQAVTRRPDGLFIVQATEGEQRPREVLARSIIVAIGQRGSPRRLNVPVPPEAESTVHYHLADARSLAGRRVVVVGLGDAAMEAAIALAHQAGTSVTILARAATYARGQPRNIAEVERLRKARRLDVRFGVEVQSVHAGYVVVSAIDRPQERNQIRLDSLLVLIGSIPPWDALARVGVGRPHRAPFIVVPKAPENTKS